jgi:hypothetical protein
MTTNRKIQIPADLTVCATGLTANYPATQSWVFNGKTYQRGDILTMLQGAIQAAQTVKTTNEAWRASVVVENGLLAALHPVLGALKKALEAQWGATSSKMTEFGFAPGKATVRTAASKAASAAKAKATKEAKKAALGAVGKTAAAQPSAPAAAPPVTAPVPPKTA